MLDVQSEEAVKQSPQGFRYDDRDETGKRYVEGLHTYAPLPPVIEESTGEINPAISELTGVINASSTPTPRYKNMCHCFGILGCSFFREALSGTIQPYALTPKEVNKINEFRPSFPQLST